MSKYLPFIIIGTLLMFGGIYFYATNTKTTNPHGEHMNNKPVAESHSSYEIDATEKPNPDQIILNEPITIKYKIKNDNGDVIKDFAIAHEKIMHFIIVRKDLTQFSHLHPDYNKETGEFSVDVNFTVDGPYRFFADFTPGEDNPQKLPVAVHSDINVGDVSVFQSHKLTVSTNNRIAVGPVGDEYLVSYDLSSEIKSKTPFTYSLTIEKNGQPVKLEKYLGALGHSVILKKDTLDYIHTHAGEQASNAHDGHSEQSMELGNKINFSTTFPESGIYRIFTQFQYLGKVVTSEYTVGVN